MNVSSLLIEPELCRTQRLTIDVGRLTATTIAMVSVRFESVFDFVIVKMTIVIRADGDRCVSSVDDFKLYDRWPLAICGNDRGTVRYATRGEIKLAGEIECDGEAKRWFTDAQSHTRSLRRRRRRRLNNKKTSF